jgi:uncharacterized cupin superfamily protein
MEKGRHRLRLQRLGGASGGNMLGANLTELAPRSVSFPFHYHCATEEAIYVLSGSLALVTLACRSAGGIGLRFLLAPSTHIK